MYLTWLTLLVLATEGWSQDEDDGPYRGKLIGKLNSYHHQVTGEVYAVDEWTLLLVNFNYDGTGDDTFFWAGDSVRPGPQGFIVPDQHGKTNILERYYNEDVRLTMPEGKRVSRLKWFAVYDIASQNAFGDVYVPDEFSAPAPLAAGALAGSGVTSAPLQLLDANTILIPELHYDGAGSEVYFWAGVGPQPSARGFKIPDEYGYLEPLPKYTGGAVRLSLPGEHSLLTLSWIALWDLPARRAIASVLLPERPNVPPALTAAHPHRSVPGRRARASVLLPERPNVPPALTAAHPHRSVPGRRARASVLLPERPNVPPALTAAHPHRSVPGRRARASVLLPERPNVPPALTAAHPHRSVPGRRARASVLLPERPNVPPALTAAHPHRSVPGRRARASVLLPERPNVPPALTAAHPHRSVPGRRAIASVLLPERPNVPPALTAAHPHRSVPGRRARASVLLPERPNVPPALTAAHPHRSVPGRRAIASVLLPERPNVPPALTAAHPHRSVPGRRARASVLLPERPNVPPALTAAHPHRSVPGRRAIASVLLPERPNVPPALTAAHPHRSVPGRRARASVLLPERPNVPPALTAAHPHRSVPGRRAIASVLLPERPNVPPALTAAHPHRSVPGRRAIASVLLPERPNVPPALTAAHPHRSVPGRRAIASVLLPERPNVPPALTAAHPHRTALPHCRQLHRDLQVAWEVFGNTITFQLAGKIGSREYMAFGISGSDTRTQMEGADVAVASFDQTTQRGLATDYNITAQAPCVQVLGAWRGACRDDRVGALDSNQVFTAERTQGLTLVTYRRTLQASDAVDREWLVDAPTYVSWAVGALDADAEPTFHRLWPRADVSINITQQPPGNDCFPFTVGTSASPSPWETAELFDPSLRVFEFTVGPSGGARGPGGRPGAPQGAALAWYVNGQLAPDLQIRRGLQYTFKVRGGDDPHSARLYHPLVVGLDPRGGLDQLPEPAQRARRVLAGVHYTRRGRLTPTAAGPLCLATHPPGADRRRDADYATFRAYNRSLAWTCAPGAAAELHVAPNDTWSDVVYYNSFTHAGMGGRIYVVDRPRRNLNKKGNAASAAGAGARAALVAALAAAAFVAERR